MFTAFILNHSTAPFNHLTTLWLNFSHIDVYRHLDSAMVYFIQGLRNTPQLKELTLLHSRTSLDNLNVLHDRCPMLQTITLMNVALWIGPSTKLTPTDAAIHLKTFKLRSCYFRSAVVIIDYVGGKYPNLKNLLLEGDIFEHTLKSAVRSFIAEATKLKSFKTNLFCLHTRFIKFIADNGITELDELYIGNHWRSRSFSQSREGPIQQPYCRV